MDSLLLSLIDGNKRDFGEGALVSILAIMLVFAILSIIIAITYAIGKAIEKQSKKLVDVEKETPVPHTPQNTNKVAVDLNDEDAVVATLVASIDYRQQTKKDFKVISVKEIK